MRVEFLLFKKHSDFTRNLIMWIHVTTGWLENVLLKGAYWKLPNYQKLSKLSINLPTYLLTKSFPIIYYICIYTCIMHILIKYIFCMYMYLLMYLYMYIHECEIIYIWDVRIMDSPRDAICALTHSSLREELMIGMA